MRLSCTGAMSAQTGASTKESRHSSSGKVWILWTHKVSLVEKLLPEEERENDIVLLQKEVLHIVKFVVVAIHT